MQYKVAAIDGNSAVIDLEEKGSEDGGIAEAVS